MILGEILLTWRKAKKKSLRDVAKEIGVDHVALSSFEKGHNISQENIFRILRWLSM